MLLQLRPREIVFEKGALSAVTLKLLRQQLSHVLFTPLNSKACWDQQTTLDKLTFEPYFHDGTASNYDKGTFQMLFIAPFANFLLPI